MNRLLTIKQREKIKVGDKVLIVSKKSHYKGCEAIVAHTFLYRNQVGVYPIGHEDKYHPARYEWEHDRYLRLVYDSVQKISNKEGENIMATKLTGYKQVAAIKQGYSTYYYAIYDDGRKYYPGDNVIVSGAASGMVQKIEEIIDLEEAAKRMGNKSITAEVIAYVDTSAYEERVAKRKEATELKKKMDQVIKQMDESNKYEMYAERNPELKDMLETYKKLTV